MADIGRLDVARAFKRALDLTGPFSPALGEGITPTVQLLDLETSPFSVSLPFTFGFSVGPVAAQYSYLWLQLAGPARAWVSVHRILLTGVGAAEAAVHIYPTRASERPAALTITGVRCARQNTDGIVRALPEVGAYLGSSADVPTGDASMPVRALAGTTLAIEGDWGFSAGGALAIATQAVFTAFTATFIGRVHLTSAS